MEFCIISPTAGLERYARLSKTHLVLAHEYVKDPKYGAFYNNRKLDGDFIILDNGAYEKGVPSIDWRIIQELEPDVVVLPDYPLQPWRKTWHAAIAYLDQYSHDAQEFGWLYIPQAEKGDMHGFIESYLEAVQDERISWIGIPRALAYAISDNPLARVEFARMVRKDHPDIRLHAFGMVNGDIHELGYLAQVGVTSIDSSAPVCRGLANLSIVKPTDRQFWDEHGEPVDFSRPLPKEDYPWHERVLENLEACGVRIPTR